MGLTGVVRHGCLVCVALLLETHVTKLQHRGHHLQHAYTESTAIKMNMTLYCTGTRHAIEE